MSKSSLFLWVFCDDSVIVFGSFCGGKNGIPSAGKDWTFERAGHKEFRSVEDGERPGNRENHLPAPCLILLSSLMSICQDPEQRCKAWYHVTHGSSSLENPLA
ncbi:hypothetical protein F3Y22_tig00111331pilonHSYRG00035 [Hibiscus syriacus]|uniref:Uncharacterized protein n=1 Tax=Hibiscus syriacus TaxID=106335 RepID=A0A6A2YPM4_HIBSY|nr:hypothetical protein F3Y22_tig00111331pilonHSYRG00035 [Hibiscus syriacus]